MVGGHGIFFDGLMFGLVADSILYLKVDKEIENDIYGQRAWSVYLQQEMTYTHHKANVFGQQKVPLCSVFCCR